MTQPSFKGSSAPAEPEIEVSGLSKTRPDGIEAVRNAHDLLPVVGVE